MASKGMLDDITVSFVFLLVASTLGPLLFGYHLAELNAPQLVITCALHNAASAAPTLPQCIPMSPAQFGLVSSSFTVGGLFGALSAGPTTAQQGRLRAMIASALFAVAGPVFEASAVNIPLLTFGRFLSGVGAGSATVVVPIYISEISPPSKRGFFGAFTQIMTNLGILITQLLGLFLSRGNLWRVILATGGAIALIQMVALLLAGQDSPKWLAENGETAKAKEILVKIRGSRVDIDDEISSWGTSLGEEGQTLLAGDSDDVPQGQLQASPSAATSKHTTTIGVLGVVTDPETAPAVFAVVIIMVAQQFTGINSIVMYGVALLSDLLAANSAILNVLVAAVNVIITTSCAPLPDRWGRKVCLLISIAGMGISSILLAMGIMHAVPVLSAVGAITFVASFGFGLGPIPFILASELVNTEAVGATQSWALAANWIATFIVAQFFPLLNEKMGKGQVYFIFAAFALLFGTLIFWWVPETKGKRNADEVWGRKKAPTLED